MSPKKAKQEKTKKRGKEAQLKRKERAEKKARVRDQLAALTARVETLEARMTELDAARTQYPGENAGPQSVTDPLTTISGIGPRYAERLRAASITSVTDLVEADPQALAEQTSISRKIIQGWIDTATLA